MIQEENQNLKGACDELNEQIENLKEESEKL